ncbi:MAG: glycosyltransferase family 4 protein [Flavobacteriaceae bacterium]
MHIAFLTPEYPHQKLRKPGGLGTSIKNLAIELLKNNVSISVFVFGQDEDEVINDDGIVIYKIAQKRYLILGWFLYRKYLNKIINKYIALESINLIEAPDWTGITAFMSFKCPLVIRLNGSDAYFCNLDNRKQKFKNYFFERRALIGADKVVSVSKFTAQQTNQVFKINKCNTVIHNSIDASKFIPTDHPITKNQILYFGTIIRKKGVLELAKSFNILLEKKPETTLLLVGKDVVDIFENKSTLALFFDILSDKAKKRVTHIYEVPYSKINEIIAKAALITLPSFAEAFPMTWLESMAMEKALVTSDIGWATEMMIDHETGFLVNPKDHQMYAEKLQVLLENNILAKSLGKKARELVIDKFDSKKIATQNIEFYKGLIK